MDVKFNKMRQGLILVASLALFLTGCSKDAESTLPETEAQLSQTELQSILEANDYAAVVDQIITEVYENGPNSSGRFANDCYTAVHSETGFAITFENCVLNGTENINGSLVVEYVVGEDQVTFTSVYESFFVGAIELNGTRTLVYTGNSEQNSLNFSIQTNMEVTLEDGRTITESGTKIFGFSFGENFMDSGYTLAGEWTTVFEGNTYVVNIVETLGGSFNCGYLSSGIMEVSKNGLEISVDFGEGNCDEQVTIIYPNGATQTLNLND